MFYCEPCRKERDWPQSLSSSTGPCEICSKIGFCYDVPIKHLPEPKLFRSVEELNNNWKKRLNKAEPIEPCSMEEFNRKWQKAIDDRAERIRNERFFNRFYFGVPELPKYEDISVKPDVRRHITKYLKARGMIKPKPPRYDNVYFEGVAWLDSLC